MQDRRQVASLEEVQAELLKLDPDQVTVEGPWSVGQVFAHCAQSLEYSIIGFPLNKPPWFHATVGKLVLWKFLRQGYMSHKVQNPIPGAPPPVNHASRSALDRLLKSIETFQAHAEPFAPHFAYGPVDKARYGRVQAMHIVEHLESFKRSAAMPRQGTA